MSHSGNVGITSTPKTDPGGGTIVIDDAHLLFGGEYKRAGLDLILSGPENNLVLRDYFKGEHRATLASRDGAMLSGDIVRALTGHVEYAQAGGAAPEVKIIGTVSKLTGSATAIRNGVAVELNIGDKVYKGDVVQAGGNSTLGITFIDGTVFGLSSNARMVLNEMVYDPNGSANSSLLSLVQGTITFVAGQTAKNGNMKVDTPVATMGIRGTAVLVEIGFEIPIGGTNVSFKAQVLREPDGTVGQILLFSKIDPTVVLATINQAGEVTNFNPSNGTFTKEAFVDSNLSAAAKAIIDATLQTYFPTYVPSPNNANPQQQGPAAPGSTPSTPPPTGQPPSSESPQPINLPVGVPTPAPINPILPGDTTPTPQTVTITRFNSAPTITLKPVPVKVDPKLPNQKIKIPDLVDIQDPDFNPALPPNDPANDPAIPFVPGSGVVVSVVVDGENRPELQDLVAVSQTGDVTYDPAIFAFLAADEPALITVEFDSRSGPDTVHQTLALTVIGVNDAPVVTTGAPTEYLGDQPAVAVDAALVVTDIDSPTLSGATVRITENFQPGDLLGFVNTANITGVYDAATGVLTLTGTASVAEYQAALRSVTYFNDDPVAGARRISFEVDDGSTLDHVSNVATVVVLVDVSNTAPVLIIPDDAVAVDEDQVLTLTGDDAGLVDPDSGDVITLTVSVEHGSLTANGELPAGVTVIDGDGSDGALQLQGSAAAIDALIKNGVNYTPDPDFNGTDTLTVTAQDTAGATDTQSVVIQVNAVNDAPTIAAGTTLTGNVIAVPISNTGVAFTPLAQSYLTVIGPALVNGLGGSNGFGENALAANDDGSTGAIDITSVFGSGGLNFFGTLYPEIFINNNGNITFGSALATYTPSQIGAGFGFPIIAPFWADVDTRGPVTSPGAGGNSTGSNLVYYDLDTVNHVLTVTWDDVGYFNSHSTKANAFQVQLVGLNNGEFAIVYRYEDIQWTTGDFNGGSDGLGGTPARAGYSNGQGTSFEFPQSVAGQILNLENSVNVFTTSGGGVVPTSLTTSGVINFSDVDSGDIHTAISTFQGPGTALGSLALVKVSEPGANGTGGQFAWTYSVNPQALASLGAGATLTETFSVDVADQGGGHAAPQLVTVTLTGVNDAPVLANAIADQSSAEDTAWSFQVPASAFSDVDAGTTLTYSATLADGSALSTRGLSFDPATRTFSGTPQPANFNGTIDLKVTASDGTLSVSDTFTLNVTSVNDAPAFTGQATGAAFSSDTDSVAIATNVSASDIDSENYDGGSLTATVTAGGHEGDTLFIVDDQFIVGHDGEITFDADGDGPDEPVVIGTLTDNINSLTIDLNSNATDAAVAALTQAIQFSNTTFNPATGPRTVTFTLTDGGGIANGGQNLTWFDAVVEVVPSSHAPTITSDPASPTVTEDGTTTQSGAFTATDVDAGDTQTWTVDGGSAAHAPDYHFTIDQFSVAGVRGNSGTFTFTDQFSSGTTISSTNYSTTNVIGVADGRAVLDGSAAVNIPSSRPEDSFVGTFATYLSAIGAGTNGLRQGTAFSVSGTFDLSAMQESRTVYGVRFSDRVSSGVNAQPGDDIIELSVTYGMTGIARVLIREIEFSGSTLTVNVLAQTDLVVGAGDDQIRLALSYDGVNSWATGSYALLDNGVAGASHIVNAGPSFDDAELFTGENWTHAQFFAFGPTKADSVLQGTYGRLDVNQVGEWVYHLNNSAANVQALGVNDHVSDNFTVVVTDSDGLTDMQTIQVAVNGTNDAPTIDAATLTVAEDDTAPMGQTVASLFAGKFFDVDTSGSFAGIAVIANNATPDQGVWQYQSPEHGYWEDVGAASATHALAFGPATMLRFVPAPNYNGTPTGLVVYGLDDTFDPEDYTIGAGGGGYRHTIDTTVHGGSTPISANTAILDVVVTAVNDAPAVASPFSPAAIVVSNFGDQSIGLLQSDGAGGFDQIGQVGQFSNVGVGPKVAVGDVDGDGNPDIVFVDQGSVGHVGILRGGGYGSYLPAITVETGHSGESALALGDVDGDGVLDIVSVDVGSATATVVSSNGEGGFGLAGQFATGGLMPLSVAVGDVNGDGRADIVTANNGSGSASVLLGDGEGGFVPGSLQIHGDSTNPFRVALGDFNGDGRQDIVVLNQGYNADDGNSGTYSTDDLNIFLSNQSGTFSYPTRIAINDYITNSPSLAVGDVNGDGKLDIVTADSYYGVFRVFNGDGDGNFAAPIVIDTVASPVSIALGDVNGDGTVDIVAVSYDVGVSTVVVLPNDGVGGFDTVQTLLDGDEPASVAIAAAQGILGYRENQAATAINPHLTVSDTDSVTLESATVSISENFVPGEDVLSFTAPGYIYGVYDANNGILTLTGAASIATYQAVLRSVSYHNTSDDPSALPRTISYSVDDGGSENSLSAIATAIVNVVPVDDAPENQPPTAFSPTLNANEDVSSVTIEFTGTDDAAAIAYVLIDAVPSNGSLYSDAALTQLIEPGDEIPLQEFGPTTAYFVPNANFNGTTGFNYYMVDVGGLQSESPGHVTINIAPVNDAPETYETAGAGDEDTTIEVELAGQDMDGGVASFTITGVQNGQVYYDPAGTQLIEANGSVPRNGSGTFVYFKPDPDYSGTEASFLYAAVDNEGGEDPTPAVATINIDPVNDAPVLEPINPGAATYVENGDAVQIVPAVTVGDVDSENYNGGSLTVAITNAEDGDGLFVFSESISASPFTYDVFYNNESIGTYTRETSGSWVVSLNENADDAAVTALVEAFHFSSFSDDPAAGTRTVSFTLVDGGGTANGGQSTASFTADVAVVTAPPPNNAPFVVAPDNHVLTGSDGYVAGRAVDETVQLTNLGIAGEGAVTVEFWLKIGDDINQIPFGFHLYDLLIGDYSSYGIPGAAIGFNTGAADLYGVARPDLVGQWHHYAAVFVNGDASASKLYIDGVEQTLTQFLSAPFGPPLDSNAVIADDAQIGGWGYDSQYSIEGAIDEVRIWRGARTEIDIAADMNDSIAGPRPGLVAVYSFEDVANGVGGVADTSGNAHHGTFVTFFPGDVIADNAFALGSASTPEDQALVFSAAGGNAITVGDADGDPLTVTLSVDHGALTLATLGGLSVTGGQNGTATVTVSGSVADLNAALDGLSYQPGLNYTGADELVVTASDGSLNDTRTIDLSIIAVNIAPVANDDAYSVNEDGSLVVSLSIGSLFTADFDVDAEGNPIVSGQMIDNEYQSQGVIFSTSPGGAFVAGGDNALSSPNSVTFFNPTNQTLTSSVLAEFVDPATGQPATTNYVEFTPTDASATSQFIMRAYDLAGNLIGTAERSVDDHGQVNGNDTPVFISVAGIHRVELTGSSGGFFAIEGDNFRFNRPAGVGLLANDTDTENDALTTTVVGNPLHGSLTLNPDGSFTYTPDADFSGTDSFTYTANDGNQDSAPATVTITVNGVNDAPVLDLDFEDITASGSGYASVLANDGNPFPIAFTADIDDPDSTTIASVTIRLTDGQTGDFFFIPTPISNQFMVSGYTPGSFEITLSGQFSSGDYEYALTQIGFGTTSTVLGDRHVDVTVNDGEADSNAATATITVTQPPNNAPVADNDTASVEDGVTTQTSGNLLANDTDADFDDLDVTLVNGQFDSSGTFFVDGLYGQLVVAQETGDYTYTLGVTEDQLVALQGLTGSAATESFTYTVSDGELEATANLDIAVTGSGGGNDGPTATDDEFFISENSNLQVSTERTGALLANDTGESISFVSFDSFSAEGVALTLNMAGNAVSYDATGSSTLQELAAGETLDDTFQYTIADANDNTSTATVTVHVTGVNDAPMVSGSPVGALIQQGGAPVAIATAVMVSDIDSVDFNGGTLTVEISGGAQDGDSLSIYSATGEISTTVSGGVSYQGAPIGTYPADDPSTSLTFTLNANAGPAAIAALIQAIHFANSSNAPTTNSRTINFSLTDGDGTANNGSDNDSFSVNVAINNAPVAGNDGVAVLSSYSAILTSLSYNDSDADMDSFFVSGAAHDGTPASFDDSSNVFAVQGLYGTLLIYPIGNQAVTVGGFVNVAVNAGDYIFVIGKDIDGNPIADLPIYELQPGSQLIDHFTYTVSDNRGATSAPATITVTFDAADISATVHSPAGYHMSNLASDLFDATVLSIDEDGVVLSTANDLHTIHVEAKDLEFTFEEDPSPEGGHYTLTGGFIKGFVVVEVGTGNVLFSATRYSIPATAAQAALDGPDSGGLQAIFQTYAYNINGSIGADTLLGGDLADAINAGGGADHVQAFGGNDVIEIHDDNGWNIDGGDGIDIVRFTGSIHTGSFPPGSEAINIEIIDLNRTHSDSVLIDGPGVAGINADSTVRVLGDLFDTVNINDTYFESYPDYYWQLSDVGVSYMNAPGDYTTVGIVFDRYEYTDESDVAATVYVQQGVTVKIEEEFSPLISTDHAVAVPDMGGSIHFSGLEVSDADSNEDELTLYANVNNGSLTGVPIQGFTVSEDHDGLLVGNGSLAAINAVLQSGLTYTPGSTPLSVETLSFTVEDGSGTDDTINIIFAQTDQSSAILQATSAKDILIGTSGSDQFVFAPNGIPHTPNHDIVMGFQHGSDKIVLEGFDQPLSLDNLADFNGWVMSGAVTQHGNDTLIRLDVDDLTNHDAILLKNVTAASLTFNDFIIHPGAAA